jgi:copper chaperone
MNMSEKTQRILFRIIGMYCITCRPIIEKQLREERAVKRIDIDYMTVAF